MKVFEIDRDNRNITKCAQWYFKDFISGIIVIVCDDILSFLTEQEQLQYYKSLHVVFAFQQTNLLYEFELSQ